MQIPLRPSEHTPTIYDTHVYEMGYFQDSPYLHPENTTLHPYRAQLPPYNPSTDSQLAAVLLIGAAFLALLVRKLRRYIHYEASIIMRVPHSHPTTHDQRAVISRLASFTITTLLGTLCAILYYYHVQDNIIHHALYIPTHTLLALYCAIIIVSIIVKQTVSDFIHWIFFDKNNRQQWRHDRSFLSLMQCLTLLPYITIVIYTHIPPQTALISTLIILILAETTLFLRLKMIFFPKNRGFLHLMSYLCALEVMPLLVIWVILTAVTEKVTVQI